MPAEEFVLIFRIVGDRLHARFTVHEVAVLLCPIRQIRCIGREEFYKILCLVLPLRPLDHGVERAALEKVARSFANRPIAERRASRGRARAVPLKVGANAPGRLEVTEHVRSGNIGIPCRGVFRRFVA